MLHINPEEIAEYDPDRHARPFGWRWLDKRLYRIACRLNARQFAALSQRDLTRPAANLARAAVVVFSAALLLLILAMFAGGLALVVVDFPSVRMIPGGLLVLLAAVLRPRFGRVDPSLERLSPEQAPTLFRLIDRVADSIGTPKPHIVGVDRSLNAFASAVGPRRRRVLGIGLPFWVILSPQQRVALLAHELGHFANGDIRRGPLTQLAFTTVGTAVAVTRPDPRELEQATGLSYFTTLFSHIVMSAISGVLMTVHVVLISVALRDSQRAEYLADERAVAAGGSAGASALMDSLVTLDAAAPMLARAARAGNKLAEWRSAAESSRQRLSADLPQRHQRSISEESTLFASHPPTGLRRLMIEARPWRDARVALTETESAQIDAELAHLFTRARNDIGAMAR